MRKLAFASALMALGLPAQAYYGGYGIGEQSCGLLNKPPYPGFDSSVLTWVTGFITGVNAGADYMEGQNKKTFDVAQSLAVETIIRFVKEQCQKSPDVQIGDVTLDVIMSIFTVVRERRDKQEQNKQKNAEYIPRYAPPGAEPGRGLCSISAAEGGYPQLQLWIPTADETRFGYSGVTGLSKLIAVSDKLPTSYDMCVSLRRVIAETLRTHGWAIKKELPTFHVE